MVLGRAKDLGVYLVVVTWLEVPEGFSSSPLIPAGRSLLDVEFELLVSRLSMFPLLLVTGNFFL